MKNEKNKKYILSLTFKVFTNKFNALKSSLFNQEITTLIIHPESSDSFYNSILNDWRLANLSNEN